MQNLDTNRKLRGVRKKPEWGTAVMAILAPIGLGAPTSVTVLSNVPGIIELSIDMSNYNIGDNVTFVVEEQVDAANFKIFGYINVVNGSIITVTGTPFFHDPTGGFPLLLGLVPAFQWLMYIDAQTQLRFTLNQTAGILRTAVYHHNVRSELF